MQKPWCSRRGHDYLDRLCGWEDWVNCWEARKLELDLEWWVDTGKTYIEKEQQEPGGISREMALRVRGVWRAWSGPESHLVWCNRSREYMRNRKWRTRKIKWPRIRLQGLCTPPWGLCLLPSRWQHSLKGCCCSGSRSVQLSATPWTAARQASLSLTISWSLPKFMSIESVMPSNSLIFYCPLLLLPAVFPSIRVFSSELATNL